MAKHACILYYGLEIVGIIIQKLQVYDEITEGLFIISLIEKL